MALTLFLAHNDADLALLRSELEKLFEMQVVELGPSCSGQIQKGSRVVGAPWRIQGNEGTWQQYVVADEADLVRSVKDAQQSARMLCLGRYNIFAQGLQSMQIQCRSQWDKTRQA